MLQWIIDKYEDWKFEKEFQKKKKELLDKDPFIYDFTDEEKKDSN
jgi:hypothetical protein